MCGCFKRKISKDGLGKKDSGVYWPNCPGFISNNSVILDEIFKWVSNGYILRLWDPRKIKWDKIGKCLVFSCVIMFSIQSFNSTMRMEPFLLFLLHSSCHHGPARSPHSQHNLSRVPCWSCLSAHFWLHRCLFWLELKRSGTLAGATWSAVGAWQLLLSAPQGPWCLASSWTFFQTMFWLLTLPLCVLLCGHCCSCPVSNGILFHCHISEPALLFSSSTIWEDLRRIIALHVGVPWNKSFCPNELGEIRDVGVELAIGAVHQWLCLLIYHIRRNNAK